MACRTLSLGLDVYSKEKNIIMAKKIKAIDAYIAKRADFAKPILNHIRELVHKACPDCGRKNQNGVCLILTIKAR